MKGGEFLFGLEKFCKFIWVKGRENFLKDNRLEILNKKTEKCYSTELGSYKCEHRAGKYFRMALSSSLRRTTFREYLPASIPVKRKSLFLPSSLYCIGLSLDWKHILKGRNSFESLTEFTVF